MAQFEQGNTVGESTRFKPGQSGNPGGRPKGFATIARKIFSERAEGTDACKAEALVRKVYDLAVNEGNVQAIKLFMDREWPVPNRHEISGDDVPLVVVRNYTGKEFEETAVPKAEIEKAARECQERLIPSTVEDPPEVTSERVVRAPEEAEASGWSIRHSDDDERDTTAVF